MHNKTIKQSRSRSRHGPGDKPLVPSRSRPELFFTGPLHTAPDPSWPLLTPPGPRLLVDFAKAGLAEPTLVRLDVETKVGSSLALTPDTT